METVRLQTTLATTCSLELAEHPLEVLEPLEALEPLEETSEELQHPWDDLYSDNPIILVNNTDDIIDNSIILVNNPELRELNRFERFSISDEARAARNLISVMAGFLICWLPYFIWLPTSTLMVCDNE